MIETTHEAHVIARTEARTENLRLEAERGAEIVRRMTALNNLGRKNWTSFDRNNWDELEKQSRMLGLPKGF